MILKTKLWLIISLVSLLCSSLIIVVIRPTWGIDFTGGSLLELQTENQDIEKIRDLLNNETDISLSVQEGSDETLIVKSTPLTEAEHQEIITLLRRENILKEELRFESIGPTIGAELRRKSLTAVSLVVAVLIAYLAYTFRQASGFIASWKFGLAAVYALMHDLLFVMAIFVLLGKFGGVMIDTLFVTAMLAILGYSVNDTIVIFNRLKSEWTINRNESLATISDNAVKKSLVRSLNTSFTTLLVLGALLLFGGSTIRWFIVALACGTIVGTYSSLFIAPPALHFLAKVRR
jgi:preprotein translocase subunit SecF